MKFKIFSQPIHRRLPEFQDILPVYAVTAFVVYGWTLFTYLRYLQYWQRFLNVGEMAVILCYAMIADLVESLGILFVLLVICVLLPSRFLKDMFVVRGTLLLVCVFGSVLVFLNNYPNLNAYTKALSWIAVTIPGAILIAFFAAKLNFIRKAVKWLSDSMIIFLYVFLPVTAFSFLVVLVRNIA